MMMRPRTTFEITVKGDDGPVRLEMNWQLDEIDASVWREPVHVTLSPDPYPYKDHAEMWETIVYLSREDARLIRDCLTSFLGSPDLRDGDGE